MQQNVGQGKLLYMQNAALADIFDRIADYHELAGDNPFKIRAFRRAAQAVVNHNEAIEDVTERGELEKIEGLGKGTSAIAREFIATGQVRLLEGFREQYPEGLFELLRVPGLGPKRVGVLFKEAQIASIEDLKSAIENDRLKGIAGFGPGTIKNLQSGLERLAQVSRRLPLSDALNLAETLVRTLENSDKCSARGGGWFGSARLRYGGQYQSCSRNGKRRRRH